MGNEHGVADAERTDEAGIESTGRRYVLVGQEGIGKKPLALSLCERRDNLTLRSQPWLYVAPVGLQADYRTELLIASSRASALNVEPGRDYISTTSLIDSLAYSVLNTRRLAEEFGPEDEMVDAHAFASGSIMWMFKHSLRYDEIFLLKDEQQTESIPDLAETLETILQEADLPYTIFDGDPGQWVDQAATIMEGYDSL